MTIENLARRDLVYPPAGRVASVLHERLRIRQDEARLDGAIDGAALPDAEMIERLIEAAFWASLRREEGRSPRISLVIIPNEPIGDALVLERPLPLTPNGLARLAPAVELPGIHLCVGGDARNLYVWGATRSVPEFSFVVEVFEPGLVVAKYSRSLPYGKFGNLAMFKGDRVKVVDEDAARRPDCPEILAALAGADGSGGRLEHPNVLLQIALAMRAHGHGGTLLVVSDNEVWQESIVTPIRYRIAPRFTRLAEMLRAGQGDRDPRRWMLDLRDASVGLAGLTAIDGATILTRSYELLAFGAKIERAIGSTTVKEVVLTEPIVDSNPITLEAESLGGTRHLSAAQFVHDQRDALAFVASQDGRFTLFAWSNVGNRVHAHRIEALLL